MVPVPSASSRSKASRICCLWAALSSSFGPSFLRGEAAAAPFPLWAWMGDSLDDRRAPSSPIPPAEPPPASPSSVSPPRLALPGRPPVPAGPYALRCPAPTRKQPPPPRNDAEPG